jgi:hypothetical protein
VDVPDYSTAAPGSDVGPFIMFLRALLFVYFRPPTRLKHYLLPSTITVGALSAAALIRMTETFSEFFVADLAALVLMESLPHRETLF